MSASVLPSHQGSALYSLWCDHAERSALSQAYRFNLQHDELLLEDLVQIGVCALMRGMAKFDPDLGVPFEHYAKVLITNAIKTELHTVTRREALDRTLSESAAGAALRGDPPPRPDDEAAVTEVRQRVRAWLLELPPRLQEVFRLLYEEGLTQREAAWRLGVSQPRVAAVHRQLITKGRARFCIPIAA